MRSIFTYRVSANAHWFFAENTQTPLQNGERPLLCINQGVISTGLRCVSVALHLQKNRTIINKSDCLYHLHHVCISRMSLWNATQALRSSISQFRVLFLVPLLVRVTAKKRRETGPGFKIKTSLHFQNMRCPLALQITLGEKFNFRNTETQQNLWLKTRILQGLSHEREGMRPACLSFGWTKWAGQPTQQWIGRNPPPPPGGSQGGSGRTGDATGTM